MDDTGALVGNRCGRHAGPVKSPFENLFLDTYALCNVFLENGFKKKNVRPK
jgi:hypothetical protein